MLLKIPDRENRGCCDNGFDGRRADGSSGLSLLVGSGMTEGRDSCNEYPA
jgi:hypothetical protein